MIKVLPLLFGLGLIPLGVAAPASPATPAAAGALDGQNHKRVQGIGESSFKQGNYRQAADAFRQELAAHPDSVPAHLGLGRALTRLGRCDLALQEFWPYVGMKAFSSEVALSAAVCSGRLGLTDDAVTFSQLAVERDPTNTTALTNLVLSLDANGQHDDLDKLLDDLVVARDDRDASFFARAVLALRRGDLGEFDLIAREWPTDRNTARTLWGLQGQSWLDCDDPVEVSRVMRGIKRPRRPGMARMVNAEAVRRQGETSQAGDILQGRAMRNNETNDSDAIRVRVLADEGDFEAADAILSSYDLLVDADLVASAWYVAWHKSDVAEMVRLRDMYIEVRVSPLRHLYELIPIPWRTDYIPGAPMPRPPDPVELRKEAAAAHAQAAERGTPIRPDGANPNAPKGPGPGVRPGRPGGPGRPRRPGN